MRVNSAEFLDYAESVTESRHDPESVKKLFGAEGIR
jgi:hypothetical protein